MNTKQLAAATILSSLTVVVAYSRGLAAPSLPGVFELTTVSVFVSGFCFGRRVGVLVGLVSLAVYMLIPYPFAHPAAWLYSISPVLLAVMMALGAMYGWLGAVASDRIDPEKPRFALRLCILGFAATLVYDVGSSLGFALAYPAFTSVYDALVLTFIPLYYPWPPIVHTVTNTVIFGVLAPPLIRAVNRMPEALSIRGADTGSEP